MPIQTGQQMPLQLQPPLQRSLNHYYEGGFVVLQVNDVLYNLPADLLRRRSGTFGSILSLPRSGVRDVEGLSDSHPIVLHGYQSTEFDCLLDYLFAVPDTETSPSVATLISLLKMCTIFDVAGGKSHCVSRLEHHSDLSLSTKLQLCLDYKVTQWLEPAFKQLVSLPSEALSFSDVEKIPSKILHASIQLQSRIRNHRLSVAAFPPPFIVDLLCITPLSCSNEWEQAWKRGPAEMLRHPDVFYSGRNILTYMESMDAGLVCPRCWDTSLSNVKELGTLLIEEGFLEEQVSELHNWFSRL